VPGSLVTRLLQQIVGRVPVTADPNEDKPIESVPARTEDTSQTLLSIARFSR
jgi:hypothetical protein